MSLQESDWIVEVAGGKQVTTRKLQLGEGVVRVWCGCGQQAEALRRGTAAANRKTEGERNRLR